MAVGAGSPASARSSRPDEAASRDIAVLAGLLALAAALRLPGLAGRGTWDADQGNDMANLRALVTGGQIPLLGPPTSIGDVHHGALYYYLLAPAALPARGSDPIEVVAEIAVAGILAVAVTWWLARSIAGPGAGLVAGLIAATSATAVNGSTFIWNPNLIPLAAAVACAGAWQAWRTRAPAWWLVAAAGQAVVLQLHVLGIVALPALVLFFAADARRRPGERRRMLLFGLAGLGIILGGYLPLLVHELTSDFSEARHALAWLAAGGAGGGGDLLVRLVFVPLRIVAWPLTGLLTDAPVAGILAVVALAAGVLWRLRVGSGDERAATRWLAGSVALGVLILVLAVKALASVTPLPTDQYIASLEPAIVTLAGLAAAALWRRDLVGRIAAAVAVTALVGWNLWTQPPPVAADGGWTAARAAGVHLAALAGGRPLAFVGLPAFKAVTAYTYPYEVAGGVVGDASSAPSVVILCDDLFRDAIGAACGGPAEDAALVPAGLAGATLVERFSPAPGRTISVYSVPAR